MKSTIRIALSSALFAHALLLMSCGADDAVIGPRQLRSLTVRPGNAGASPGATFPFSATGTFNQVPLTREKMSAHWTTSDPGIATIDPTSGQATCVALGGPVTVSASSAGKGGEVLGSASLTCLLSNTEATFDPAWLRFSCSLLPPFFNCICSAPQTVTVVNNWSETLAIDSIAVSNDPFSQSHTCGPNLGSGESCVITVSYAPKSTGINGGDLTITDSGGVHNISVAGHASCVH
jgi:hypothetical protein